MHLILLTVINIYLLFVKGIVVMRVNEYTTYLTIRNYVNNQYQRTINIYRIIKCLMISLKFIYFLHMFTADFTKSVTKYFRLH